MELREGYKQTEVGVIPEDWNYPHLSGYGIFGKGQGVSRADSLSGDLPCIRYGEIYTRHHNIIRRFYSFISIEIAQAAVQLLKGDIIFAGSGETREEIGKCVAYIEDFEAYVGGDTVLFRPIDVDSCFLGYALNTPLATKQKSALGQGDAVVHISATSLGKLRIPLPPTKAEQEAIAEALSDADALIASLEQLIAKKRCIKQGAMQELLTGKRRLPGFSGDWEEKTLGELLTVHHGKSQREVEVSNGKYPILASGGEIGRTDTPLYEYPSVLIGRKGTIDAPQYASSPFWTVDTLFYTVVSAEADAKFLFFKFNLIPWRRYNEASGVPSLNAKTIERIEVSVPNGKEEQTAIAKVLSEMDEAIDALETKLSKARLLKQGMMQELLTGRIRLV